MVNLVFEDEKEVASHRADIKFSFRSKSTDFNYRNASTKYNNDFINTNNNIRLVEQIVKSDLSRLVKIEDKKSTKVKQKLQSLMSNFRSLNSMVKQQKAHFVNQVQNKLRLSKRDATHVSIHEKSIDKISAKICRVLKEIPRLQNEDENLTLKVELAKSKFKELISSKVKIMKEIQHTRYQSKILASNSSINTLYQMPGQRMRSTNFDVIEFAQSRNRGGIINLTDVINAKLSSSTQPLKEKEAQIDIIKEELTYLRNQRNMCHSTLVKCLDFVLKHPNHVAKQELLKLICCRLSIDRITCNYEILGGNFLPSEKKYILELAKSQIQWSKFKMTKVLIYFVINRHLKIAS